MKTSTFRAALPLVVGASIALLPPPTGLASNAWLFFAVFAAVITGLIVEPIPAAAIGLTGVALSCVLLLVERSPEKSILWALGGFANTTVWLIFAAFMFALGYEKSGLGRRIALLLVKTMGHRTLGLGYAIALSDAFLAPFMPSNTARSGGTIFPILRNIPPLYDSGTGRGDSRMGSYIMWTGLAATCVTSSMFMTALAPNLLALDLIKKAAGIEILWSDWFLGFLPLGLILLILVPYLSHKLHSPAIASSREVPAWAGRELALMGRISTKEWNMAGLALLALGLWILAPDVVHPTAVALGTVCLMVITGVVTWDDVLSNRGAWNVLVWFATLVAMAEGLSKVGFTSWLGATASTVVSGFPPTTVMLFLVALFFFSHYLFASVTAHTMAMLPMFIAVGAAVPNMNVTVLVYLLGYSLGLVGILTPYATGPSPIYYGSGYIARGDFWTMGAIFGFVFLMVLLGVGIPYLLALHS